MNDLLESITKIRNFFKNPENFKTTSGKLEGIMISNWMDAISAEFIKEYIEPEIKQNAKELILDVGAKA